MKGAPLPAVTSTGARESGSASSPPTSAPPLLRFRDLRKAFGGQTVLDGISGEIRPGEVILLRGENGSGKTTLLNTLSGCLEPDRGSIEITQSSGIGSDRFDFPRPWYRDWNPFHRFTPERVARLGVGRTWQDIRLFGSLDLADNIAAASADKSDSPWAALFRWRDTSRATRASRQVASSRLTALGLSDRDNSSANRISLGQSKRVAIARALHADARLLFLDEPLSGLDADGIRDILIHLRELAEEHELALVIVEHVLNIPHILELASKVWTLQRGRLLEDGIPTVGGTGDANDSIRAIIQRHLGPAAHATEIAFCGGATLATWRLNGGQEDSEQLCEVLDLKIARGSRVLFDTTQNGLRFTIRPNTINLIEAPNGWGKTSLLACLAGVIPSAGGLVRLSHRAVSKKPTWARYRQGVRAMVLSSKLFPSLSVAEHCRLVRLDHPVTVLPSAGGNSVGYLSGGQRQRLRLHLLNNRGRHLSLLDEPLESLDLCDYTHLKTIFECPPGGAILIAVPSTRKDLYKPASLN